MPRILDLAPDAFAARILTTGRRRAWLARAAEDKGLRASDPGLEALAAEATRHPDEHSHEAIFFEVGPESGALLAAFLHSTLRGQTQGGVRCLPYPSLEALVRDGLRLSLAMGRKCALAGLWWGGGKGVIALPPRARSSDDPGWRRALFADWGRFVTSLAGCHVTAEDAGTAPADLAVVHEHTRFATCVPTAVGGSGNPAECTAQGVVAAMEAALGFLDGGGPGSVAGRHVAMQGGGHVGAAMLRILLERGASLVTVADTSTARCEALLARYASDPVEVRAVEPCDESIFAMACDVLAPNALGGVLHPKTIAALRAPVVCGAANNLLDCDDRDARLLAERGIVHVPDFVANRMGIVSCANEQAGHLPHDPEIERHLDPAWEHSIPCVTREVLERARREGCTPTHAANAMADARSSEPHPIWGDRATRIVASLVEGDWANGEALGADPTGC